MSGSQKSMFYDGITAESSYAAGAEFTKKYPINNTEGSNAHIVWV